MAQAWLAPLGTDPGEPGWTEIGTITDDGLVYEEPEITAASIAQAWERLKPRPVCVFCPPADVKRITAWCEDSPNVRVVGSRFVPEGEIWMFKGLPFTDEEIRDRIANQGD